MLTADFESLNTSLGGGLHGCGRCVLLCRYLVLHRQDGLVIPTLADWLLFTHLIRFDAVENVLFKANLHRVRDYTHLQVLCPSANLNLILGWLAQMQLHKLLNFIKL